MSFPKKEIKSQHHLEKDQKGLYVFHCCVSLF